MPQNEDEEVEFPPTCPTDPRFPNTNATKYCFTMFVDYMRCTRLYSEGHEPCEYFKRCYKSICPNDWVAKWEEQISDGTFPYTLPEKK